MTVPVESKAEISQQHRAPDRGPLEMVSSFFRGRDVANEVTSWGKRIFLLLGRGWTERWKCTPCSVILAVPRLAAAKLRRAREPAAKTGRTVVCYCGAAGYC